METFIIQARQNCILFGINLNYFFQATKFSKFLGNCCFIVKTRFTWKHRSLKLGKAEFYLKLKS